MTERDDRIVRDDDNSNDNNIDDSEFGDNLSDARERTSEGAPFPGTGGEKIGTPFAGDGGGYPHDLRTGGGIASPEPGDSGGADDTDDATSATREQP